MRPIEFLVLAVLAERDLHGYGIVQAIEETTEQRVRPKAGNLYRVLDRLHEREWLELAAPGIEADGDDARRRYYAITTAGRAALREEVALLGGVVDALRGRAPTGG